MNKIRPRIIYLAFHTDESRQYSYAVTIGGEPIMANTPELERANKVLHSQYDRMKAPKEMRLWNGDLGLDQLIKAE